jgi:SpoVK/Ycf46/Vps4 family AAA+-type ATPase
MKKFDYAVPLEDFLRRMRRFKGKRALRKSIKKQKFCRYGIWKMLDEMRPTVGPDIFLGTSDLGDYLASNFIKDKFNSNQEVFINEFSVIADKRSWNKFIADQGLFGLIYQMRDSSGYAFNADKKGYIDYSISSTTVTIRAYGQESYVNAVYDLVNKNFEEVRNVIEWVYNTDGGQVEVPITNEKAPCIEMYPFLNTESLDDYYDSFMRSSASILVLIGPPGTGKTTFIRGLLQHTEMSAMVTYDPAILAKDYMFAQFLDGDRNILVLEDADNFLNSRSEGNDIMHKFLNVGDGLITMKNKKIIFSTNLPSLNSVDPALIRPGRCHDVIKFNLLDYNQAKKLSNKLNIEFNEENNKKEFSLAEIFHKKIQNAKIERKIGFV